MTDAQMLQNLLAVEESMVIAKDFIERPIFTLTLPKLKEVIAELRRRVELEDLK